MTVTWQLLALISGITLVWVIFLTVWAYKAVGFYQKQGPTIKADQQEQLKQIQDELGKLKSELGFVLQKIGLVRFNPFAETGGDQSFSVALLDGHDTGLLVTGLHSRETTRVYAKTIKNGQALNYELSDEEKQAIKEAKIIK